MARDPEEAGAQNSFRRVPSPPTRYASQMILTTRSITLAVAVSLFAGACANGSSTAASGPTVPVSPSSSSSPTDSPSASPSPPASATPVLPDGRSFVFVKKVSTGGGGSVRFDLAYFLTGQAASDAAKAHGDEYPPPNDYYIVNDNPLLRTLSVAPDVIVHAYDWNNCCDSYSTISFADWAAHVKSPSLQWHGADSPWWIVVHGGVIVKIEEQFLP